MNNEQLNTALYEKMFAEQDKFRGWLLTQPPEEILKHTYEYTVREDILMSMEEHDISDEQASALLQSDSPLTDVYQEFESRESDYMETVLNCITDRADDVLRHEQEQRQALLNTPVYKFPGDYAAEHGESAQYRASHKANIACKEAIEAAISEHYSNNRLNVGGVAQVVEQFGYERTFFVLANTVKHKDWDGRISRNNKEWAKTVPVFEDKGGAGDRTVYFVMDKCNPGLTDLFITQARREEKERKPSVLDKLQKAKVEPKPPSTSKHKDMEL